MIDKIDLQQPLYQAMGLVRIVKMDPEGSSTLEYQARAEMCHSGGVVQGGFISGWIDAAMAHAAMARHGDAIVPMSLELKVSFFAPTRPGLVIAEGWVERKGRRTEATSTILMADAKKVQDASKAALSMA